MNPPIMLSMINPVLFSVVLALWARAPRPVDGAGYDDRTGSLRTWVIRNTLPRNPQRTDLNTVSAGNNGNTKPLLSSVSGGN
jgi:hypothetical protein